MTWDGSKGGEFLRMIKEEKKMRELCFAFLEKNKKVGGTCSRKPKTLFSYNIDFKCCFGIFFNKTWDYVVIWIGVFSNTKKHILLQ